MPVLTPAGSSLSSASNPRRDDGDGRDDILGAPPGVKNIVTIDTIVTHPLASPVPTMKSAEFSVDSLREIFDFLSGDGQR